MHDALYGLLHDGALDIRDDIRSVETLGKALTPGSRQAIKHIKLSLQPENTSWVLKFFHPQRYPGLEMLSVEVWPDSDAFGDKACAERSIDAVKHLMQPPVGVNPRDLISWGARIP